MLTPGTLESPRIEMLSLDMPLEHTFAREQTVILTALPFAFEIPIILAVPRRSAFSMRMIMIALGKEENTLSFGCTATRKTGQFRLARLRSCLIRL